MCSKESRRLHKEAHMPELCACLKKTGEDLELLPLAGRFVAEAESEGQSRVVKCLSDN